MGTHRYREHYAGCHLGELENWVKKMKELRSTYWQLQNNPGDVKYSMGNTVSNIVITM